MYSPDLRFLQNLCVAYSSVLGLPYPRSIASRYAIRRIVQGTYPRNVGRARFVWNSRQVFLPKPRCCCSCFKTRSLFVPATGFPVHLQQVLQGRSTKCLTMEFFYTGLSWNVGSRQEALLGFPRQKAGNDDCRVYRTASGDRITRNVTKLHL
jgi:hypothetical protein